MIDKSKFLAGDKPVARDVTFTDGTVETLNFLPLDAGHMRRWRSAEASEDEEVRSYGMQRMVQASLCDENGKLVLTEKEALRLSAQGLTDLFPHVLAVSGMGASEKKASPSAEAVSTSAASSDSRSASP